MRTTVKHPVWGTVVYDEGFWSGKREIWINGYPLTKKDRKTFLFADGGAVKTVRVKGSYYTGLSLLLDGEELVMVEKPTWYEITASVLILVVNLIWGNSVTLCSIIPIVGGAIGGGISGVMGMLNLVAMRASKSPWVKLAIWAGMLFVTMFICFVIGLLILAFIA